MNSVSHLLQFGFALVSDIVELFFGGQELRQLAQTIVSDGIEVLKSDNQHYDPDSLLHLIFFAGIVFLFYVYIGIGLLWFVYFKPDWPMEAYGNALFLISNSAWLLLVFTKSFLTLSPLVCVPLQIIALGHYCGLFIVTRMIAFVCTTILQQCLVGPEFPLLLLHLGFSVLMLWALWSDLLRSLQSVEEKRAGDENRRAREEVETRVFAANRAEHLRQHEANVKALASFQEAGYMEKGGKELTKMKPEQRISLLWGGLDELPRLPGGLSLKDVRLVAREYAEDVSDGSGSINVWIDRLALAPRIRVRPFIQEQPLRFNCLVWYAPPPNDVIVVHLDEHCHVQHLGYDYGCTFAGCAEHW
jgi:hypothetical protein